MESADEQVLDSAVSRVNSPTHRGAKPLGFSDLHECGYQSWSRTTEAPNMRSLEPSVYLQRSVATNRAALLFKCKRCDSTSTQEAWEAMAAVGTVLCSGQRCRPAPRQLLQPLLHSAVSTQLGCAAGWPEIKLASTQVRWQSRNPSD